jgi:outer membrane protein assembly factor BamB
VFHDGKIIVGTVGRTYAYFPIAAIDVATGEVAWRAADVGMAFQTGNVRSAPLVVGDEVVFTCAYSDGLFAVSLANGEYRWRVRLGQEMFEQWSGPIARGNGLYLGRHDGYLHKVDMSTKKRVWSIYLGDDAAAGAVIAADQKGLKFDAPAAWRAGQSAPILATPRIDRGRLYVGTNAGYLYSIEELGL